MANIPKAAMRATNNVMRGYIPHNGIVSAGAKIVAKNQSGSRSAGKKKHRTRLTEISRGNLEKNHGSFWRFGGTAGTATPKTALDNKIKFSFPFPGGK